MTADRRIVFEITGDATGWALAVKDAQNLNQQAVTNATALNNNLKRLDDERAANYLASIEKMAKAVIAFAAISEVAKTIQSVTHTFADMGHAVTGTALIFGTTAEKASLLRGEFEALGMAGDATTKVAVRLVQDMQKNEAEFNKLGIATRDASGNLLNAHTTLTSLRQVLSAAGNDANKLATIFDTVAKASTGGAAGIEDLYRWLNLTDAQVKVIDDNLRSLGLVMTNETAKGADDLWQELQTLKLAQEGAALSLSQSLAPAVEWLTHAFLVATEVLKNWVKGLIDVGAAVVKVVQGDITGAIESAKQAWASFGDALNFDQIIAKVQKQIDAGKALAAIQAGTVGAPVTGKGGNTIQEQQAELRATLERYLAEKQAAIDAITEERTARDAMWNDLIEQTTDLETKRRQAHQDEIERINDETTRLQDQYTLRQRGREDAIAGLREQISLLDRAFAIETAQDQLAKDQKALRTTTAEGAPTIRRGEHLEDYYARVHAYEVKLADEKKKIEDDKEKIARDAQKAILEQQIKTIEAIGRAEQRALEDERRAAAQRIKDIQEVQKAEEARTAAAVKSIRDQMKDEDAASKAKVKGLQAEMKQEKERVDDQILALDKLLKKHTSFASGVGDNNKQIEESASRAALQVERLNRALAGEGTAWGAQPEGTPSGSTMGPGLRPGGLFHPGALSGWSETHAGGGSIYLSSPTAIVGMGRGTMAVAGAGETINITPRGGGRGGRSVEVTVNVIGLAYPDAVREVARAVHRELAMEDAAKDSFGFTQKS